MRVLLLCCLASLALLACAAPLMNVHEYSEAALKDETVLPGAPPVSFKMFSGYIPVGPNKDRALFYVFATSSRDATKDPVVLWTNGGPGCSGLGGFMTEQGPFRPTNGTDLEVNPYAWNQVANMLFIEQPAGVGYSYTNATMQYGDDQAASDNHDFVLGFFEKFPQYKANDFYISSESYGGHYMPTLAKEIVTKADVPNFKGFIVGNPLTYMPYRDYGQYGTFWNHQLLPKPLWDSYLQNNCQNDSSTSECQSITGQMDGITTGLDPYALDFPVCESTLATGRDERYALMSMVEKAHPRPKSIRGYFPKEYVPCSENWAGTYLNRPDVQAALHVMPGITWALCSPIDYPQADVVAPMMPLYHFLLEGSYNLKIMVYSGDDDSVCATLGTQQFIWDLGRSVTQPWAAWKVDNQIAGYTVGFDGIRFTTVHGAGHMVPATRPEQALALFTKYLEGW